jgi:hypothetical protein
MLSTDQIQALVTEWLKRAALLDSEGLIAASRAVSQCARELDEREIWFGKQTTAQAGVLRDSLRYP